MQLQCFGSCSHPPPPRPQLRCVFDACDTTGSGLISLRQLANVSRSHVNGATQVLANSKFCCKQKEPQLMCLHRWSRSWTYLTLGKTGLRTINLTSVSFTQRSVAVIEMTSFSKALLVQISMFTGSCLPEHKWG